MRPSLLALVSAGLALVAVGCSKPTREWNANDHDEEPTAPGPGGPGQLAAGQPGQGPGATAPNAAAKLDQMGPEELAGIIEGVWKNVCLQCHGPAGKGDGPKGPMVGAADLGAPAVQGLTDQQLAQSIQNGKGKMPAYPKLPPVFITGLVGKVRSFKAP